MTVDFIVEVETYERYLSTNVCFVWMSHLAHSEKSPRVQICAIKQW